MLSCRFSLPPPLLFFVAFSSLRPQFNTMINWNWRPFSEEYSIVRPIQLSNPHWVVLQLPIMPLSSPFGNSLLCFTSEKRKWVGCEHVSQAPGNEWRTEGTNQRAGRRNMRRDVRVTSAKHTWTRRLEQWCTLLALLQHGLLLHWLLCRSEEGIIG